MGHAQLPLPARGLLADVQFQVLRANALQPLAVLARTLGIAVGSTRYPLTTPAVPQLGPAAQLQSLDRGFGLVA